MRSVFRVIVFVSMTCIAYSCGCNMDCPDCYKLNEESCDCIPQVPCLCSNGILDEGEDEIDCGGKCDPCFDCLTNWCAVLSGATTDQPDAHKTWISGTSVIDFQSNGRVIFVPGFSKATGTWKFDDANSPTKIFLEYDWVADDWPYEVLEANGAIWGIVTLADDQLTVLSDGEATYYPG